MTLAAVLSVSMFFSASMAEPCPPAVMQSAEHPTTATLQTDTPAPQAQTSSPPVAEQQVPTASPTQTPVATAPKTPPKVPTKAAAAKRSRNKKPVSNCTPVAAGTSTAASGQTADGTGTAATSVANCPPPKVVVRDGGTSEPSIQLLGGADGAQTSGKRSTTEQLLGATEANLKKIAGLQLNSNQKEMVNQIHQFVEQAKAAVTAGDVERGHNLALKARLLSDELTKP